jgi:allantoin racemase
VKLLYINPNSTVAMTQSAVAVARSVADVGVNVHGWTNHDGPRAIQGAADGVAAVAGVLALLPQAKAEGFDAIIIACFDDTGLEEIRQAAHCPVLGIGQAAFHMAALLGQRFSVVTTLAVSVPVIMANVDIYGFGPQCASIRPSDLPVLVVEEGAPETLTRLKDEISRAESEDEIGAVVLGCAGMAALHFDLQKQAKIPLIDGIAAAAWLAPALVRAGRLKKLSGVGE